MNTFWEARQNASDVSFFPFSGKVIIFNQLSIMNWTFGTRLRTTQKGLPNYILHNDRVRRILVLFKYHMSSTSSTTLMVRNKHIKRWLFKWYILKNNNAEIFFSKLQHISLFHQNGVGDGAWESHTKEFTVFMIGCQCEVNPLTMCQISSQGNKQKGAML